MQDTLSTQRLHGLDHLRALAITLVVLFHYRIPIFGHPEWLNTYAKFGWTGVDLFFVLSGYLIASQLLRELSRDDRIDMGTFYSKRAFRILPAYWLMVTLYFLLPGIHEREALPPLWRFLTFTQNLGLDIAKEGTFSHAWSLCVEEHFYLLLPAMLLLANRIPQRKYAGWLVIAALCSGIAIRHYSWLHNYQPFLDDPGGVVQWYRYIYYPSYTRPDGLAAGVGLAAFVHYKPALWQNLAKHGNWLLAGSIALLAAAYSICNNEQTYNASVYGFTTVAAGYTLMVASAISPTCVLYKTRSKGTAWLATLSYGIYLTHKAVIHCTQAGLESCGANTNSNLTMLICTVACAGAAALLYALVERPFMALRKKVLRGE